MTMVTEQLPPDVERDQDTRRLMRRRKVHRGFLKADGSSWDPDADKLVARAEEDHDIVKRPCIIGAINDSDEETERKRQQAVNAKEPTDFWHPILGWLAGGTKKETEWPENEGSMVKPRERVRTSLPVQAEPTGRRTMRKDAD